MLQVAMQGQQYDYPPPSEAPDEFINVAYEEKKDASLPETPRRFIYSNAVKPVRRQRATLLLSWLTITALLVFLAIGSICWHRPGKKGVSLGASPRRLAGSEQDESDPFPLPPSPELEAICAQLGDWQPAEPGPGEPRRSPETLQAFFEVIEKKEIQQPGSLPSYPPPLYHLPYGAGSGGGGAPKRPATSASDSSDDERPGPSWKAAKYAHPPQLPPLPAAAAGSSAAAPSMAPAPALPPPSGAGQSPLLFTTSAGATQGPPVTSSAEGPSTFAAAAAAMPPAAVPPGRQAADFPLLHSIVTSSGAPASGSAAAPGQATTQGGAPAPRPVRRPANVPYLRSGVVARAWATSSIFGPSQQRPFFPALSLLRSLLTLHDLDSLQLHLLMSTAEQLANHAFWHMTASTDYTPSNENVEILGSRLLVLHALYMAAHVVAVHEPSWWSQLVAAIPPSPTFQYWRPMPFLERCRVDLLNRLADALEKLRKFEHPGDDEVRGIIRVLLRAKETSPFFLHPRWDHWRRDRQ